MFHPEHVVVSVCLSRIAAYFNMKLSGILATREMPRAIRPSLIVVFRSGGGIKGLKWPSPFW